VTAARRLRAASVQMEHRDGDREANFTKIERFVAEAAAQGAQLVVFPECCVCGYWFIRNLSIDELPRWRNRFPKVPARSGCASWHSATESPLEPDGLRARIPIAWG
jgi:hypothetical protein